MKRYKLLAVEDGKDVQQRFRWSADEFGGLIELDQALNITVAKDKFDETWQGLNLITMDACVPGTVPNTMDLVRYMRQTGYKGSIIAASSEEAHNMLLMRAGCDHWCLKDDLFPGKVAEVLGLGGTSSGKE